jgi:hypothetical protein
MGSSSPPNLLEVDASIIDIKYKVFKVRSQGGGGGAGVKYLRRQNHNKQHEYILRARYS